jgi:hypothetical protein
MEDNLREERFNQIKKILGNKGEIFVSGVSFNTVDGNPSFKGIFKDLFDLGYVFHVSKTESAYKVKVNYNLGSSQNA